MGLGKTVQMIAFLAGLKHSKMSAKKSKWVFNISVAGQISFQVNFDFPLFDIVIY